MTNSTEAARTVASTTIHVVVAPVDLVKRQVAVPLARLQPYWDLHEPEADGAFPVDGTLKVLPGLTMISGRGNGYSALRSRETMAARVSMS